MDENNSTYEKIINRYSEVDIKKKFNPYKFRNNVEPYIGGIPIIFMTTPQMNIFEDPNDSGYTNGQALVSMITGRALDSKSNQIYYNSTNSQNTGYASSICKNLDSASSLFGYYFQTDPELVRSLTYGESLGGTSSPWIKFLTNLFKGTNLKDLSMRTVEEYETYLGWKQIMPGPNIDSYSADNGLSVTYDETKNLDVIKFHTLWMEYIEAVRYGNHSPSVQMRMRRTIDYTSSLYFFILDFDMSKILYWCKYTGIYPTNVPYSVLTPGDITTRNPTDVTITYAYQYKEELRPTVIYDFNSIAKFSHKVVAYGRGSYLHDNNDDSNDVKRSSYGWGDIDFAYDTTFGGFDFSKKENKEFNNVEIKLLSNSRYDDRNQTGFASDTNMNRRSFHLIFTNRDNEGVTAYENTSLGGMVSQDVLGKPDSFLGTFVDDRLSGIAYGTDDLIQMINSNGGILGTNEKIGENIYDLVHKNDQKEINAGIAWVQEKDRIANQNNTFDTSSEPIMGDISSSTSEDYI